MPFISIVSPCYNEEENVEELYRQVRDVFSALPGYTYEHIYIDNASKDRTAALLRELARSDGNVKVILNARNFGHTRSPHHALLQARGEAVILMASDLQDPPSLIPEFLKRWEQGAKIVAAVKRTSHEVLPMRLIRSTFYWLIGKISNVEQIRHFTGFGLYDRAIVDIIRTIQDPDPYFRGLISEIGYDIAQVPFEKPERKRGKTKNNFLTLFDLAMLGITTHSRLPIRLATLAGFGMSVAALIVAFGYLVYKLLFWDRFEAGTAPVVIGIYFFASVQIFFIGMLGEYIGVIFTHMRRIPLVIERERINFDEPAAPAGQEETGR